MDRPPATTDRAAAHFEVRLCEPGRLSRWWRAATLLVLGLFTSGAGPTNPGGRQARIVDRASGATLRTVREHLGDSPGGAPLEVVEDLQRLDPDAFRRRWL